MFSLGFIFLELLVGRELDPAGKRQMIAALVLGGFQTEEWTHAHAQCLSVQGCRPGHVLPQDHQYANSWNPPKNEWPTAQESWEEPANDDWAAGGW